MPSCLQCLHCLRASHPSVPTVESTVCGCEVSVHCAVYGVHCEVVVRVIQYYHLHVCSHPLSCCRPSSVSSASSASSAPSASVPPAFQCPQTPLVVVGPSSASSAFHAFRPPVPTVESTVRGCEVSVHRAVYGVHCEVVVRVIQYSHLSLQPVSSCKPLNTCFYASIVIHTPTCTYTYT